MDWSGVDYCDVFIRLSFWRHPFTAEHLLLRLMQCYIYQNLMKKHSSNLGWPEVELTFSNCSFWLYYSFKSMRWMLSQVDHVEITDVMHDETCVYVLTVKCNQKRFQGISTHCFHRNHIYISPIELLWCAWVFKHICVLNPQTYLSFLLAFIIPLFSMVLGVCKRPRSASARLRRTKPLQRFEFGIKAHYTDTEPDAWCHKWVFSPAEIHHASARAW